MREIIYILGLIYSFSQVQAQESLNFDGIDEYVQTTYYGISGSNARTVEAWIKTNSTVDTPQDVVVDWGEKIAYKRFTLCVLGGKARLEIGSVGISSTSSVDDGAWHHIAATSSGTTLKLYVDGILEGSFIAPLNTTSSYMKIGVRTTNKNDKYFGGEIDELRVWNIAKTETQIRDAMFHELEGTETNLTAYYSFEGATNVANGVTDLVSGNDGTMTNMEDIDVVTSYAAIRTTSVNNNIRGIWQASGIASSLPSDGFLMDVNTPLSETNYTTYGHNNSGTAIVTTDVPPGVIVARYEQIWHVLETGSVMANITFNLSTINGTAISAGTASGYKLLYRSGTSGDFTLQFTPLPTLIVATDQVVFRAIPLNDGYYTLGTTDIITSPLPIELIAFEGKYTNSTNTVLLEWATASEVSNDYFTIERSRNATNWEEIIRLAGSGNSSSLLNYSSIDENPLAKIAYYRLKQTDFDGQFEYSKPIIVNTDVLDNSSLDIYPNPTNAQITVKGDYSELKHIKLYNVLGKDISFKINITVVNNMKLIINLRGLNSGIYFLNTKTTVYKVYKQ